MQADQACPIQHSDKPIRLRIEVESRGAGDEGVASMRSLLTDIAKVNGFRVLYVGELRHAERSRRDVFQQSPRRI